jgi:hypothetical protein
MKAIKMKFGTPFLEFYSRLWVSDPKGNGRGFDTVWDTYQYLVHTGQLTGSMTKKMTITLEDLSLTLKWLDFKALILLKGSQLKEYCKYLGLKTNPRIRQKCFDQMSSGKSMELFFNKIHSLGGQVNTEVVEEEISEYASMSKAELVSTAVDMGIVSATKAKKLSVKELVELLESNDQPEQENDEE